MLFWMCSFEICGGYRDATQLSGLASNVLKCGQNDSESRLSGYFALIRVFRPFVKCILLILNRSALHKT